MAEEVRNSLRRKKRRRLARAGLVVASTFFSLMVAEVAVRTSRGALFDTSLLSAEFRSPDGVATNTIAQYDARLGWLPLLGKSRQNGATYTVVGPYNTRSNGQPRPRVPESAGTVLVLGDSFAFGQDVDDHEAWPALLETAIQRPVINAGVMSFGLDQIVLRGEDLIPRVQPDLVLVLFIPDDIRRCEQSSRAAYKPYFAVVDGELELRNVPVPTDSRPRRMDLFRRTAGYSHLADLIMRRFAIEYWLDMPIEIAWDGPFDERQPSDPTTVACSLMERVSAWRDTTQVVLVSTYAPELDHAVSVPVLNCARRAGLDVIDLHEYLWLERDAGGERWDSLWTESGHMTAHGNAMLADWVLRELRRLHDRPDRQLGVLQ